MKERSPQKHEVVIVGAGPAGSMLAYALASSGIGVALLDKAEFPREKPCGDGIGPRSLWMLRQLGWEQEVSSLGYGPIDKIRLTSFGKDELLSRLQADLVPIDYGFIVRRLLFDDLLRKKAIAAGAFFQPGIKISSLLKEGSRVVGVKGAIQGEQQEFRGKLTVLATGHHQLVADSAAALSASSANRGAIALRLYLSQTTPTEKAIHIFFDARMARGFGWSFPTGENSLNYGIGLLLPNRSPVKKLAEEVLKDRKQASESSPGENWRGAPMRMHYSHAAAVAREGAACVGEAAGLVSPINGEGVCFALESSALLGEMLAKRGFKEMSHYRLNDTLIDYQRELASLYGSYFFYARSLQLLLRHPLIMNTLIRRASGNPELGALVAGVLGSVAHPKKLFNPLTALRLL